MTQNRRLSLLSIADQLVCSGSNFVATVLLTHALAPEAFGAYMLVFAAVMILGGAQQGFVTGPYRSLGATRGLDDGYVSAQLRIQLVLVLVEAAALVLFLCLQLDADADVIAAAVVLLALFQLHEFVRTMLTTRLSLSRLLAIDVLTHGTRLGALVLCLAAGTLDVASALACVAAPTLIAATQLRAWRLRPGELAAVWWSNVRFGRWLLVESLAHVVSTRAYLYAVGALLGHEQVAGLSASQNIAAGVNVVAMGLTAAAVPIARLALEREGYGAWRRWLTQVSWLVAFVTGAVFVAIAAFAGPIMGLLYPDYYGDFAPIAALLAFGVWLESMTAPLSSAFWTAERADLNAVGKVAAAAFAVVWMYPGVEAFGLYGVVVGLIATPVIWLLVGGLLIRNGSLARARVANAG
jgi:O-antigen/teichoic acid export membrane protein